MNWNFLPNTEMGNLIREKDWEATAMGSIDSWPEILHTAVSIMMNSRFPMFLFWGPELISFYNDAYRPSFGTNGMHPAILGKPAEEAWSDVWHIVKKFPEQVLTTGVATWEENQLIPIYRNGKTEDVYWTFSHSPVYNKSGNIEGIFVLCMETTQEVLSAKKIKESEERFRTMAENSTALIAVGDETSHASYFNKAWIDLTGRPMDDLLKIGWVDLVHQKDKDRFLSEYLSAFEKRESFSSELRVLNKQGKYSWIFINASPRYYGERSFAGFVSTGTDITEQKESESRLREQQRLYEAVTQNTPDLVYVFDLDYRFTFANEALLAMWGRTWDQSIGKGLLELGYESWHAQMHEKEIDQVIATKNSIRGIVSFQHASLGKRIYDYIFAPVLNEKGEVEAVAGITRDISDLKQAAEKIVESEQRFKTVADSAPVLIWMSGTDALYNFFNSTWLAFTGRKMEEETGNGWRESIHPNDMERCLDIYLFSFNKREAFHIEYRLRRHDGQYRWLSNSGTPRFTSEGAFEGFIGACFDIHDRIMFEIVLREREEKFRLLADSMPQFVWTSNEKGELNYFNKAIYNFSGLSKEDIERDGWLQIVHVDERKENIKQWLRSIDTGEEFNFEHRFRRHDGKYRWQLSRAIPQRNEKGEIQMWVGISTEIHQQKEMREELEQKVKARTHDLVVKNNELERMNKELESFTYISSHDLQEPLRKIQTIASRILQTEKHNLSENGKDYFQRMQQAASRMQRLIEDLLSFSRTATGERKFELTKLSVIVEEVKEDLKESINDKRAIIEITRSCEINIIPFQFHQLIQNLISNALKFAKKDQHPHIIIESNMIRSGDPKNTDALPPVMLLTDKEYCYIKVKDNGIGFDQQYSDRIFEVFQQLHGKNEYVGTGIGLAIVKKIIDNHNGFITAIGVPGEGATFNIFIPN